MAKFLVCPECEGEGYVGTLGAFTPGEFWEQFDDAQEYLEMHEASKQACAFCNGQRVVTSEKNDEYQDYLEYEAERNAERRMGC